MCAAHTGCEYFLFGKVGTSWENECWMEKTAGMKPGNGGGGSGGGGIPPDRKGKYEL